MLFIISLLPECAWWTDGIRHVRFLSPFLALNCNYHHVTSPLSSTTIRSDHPGLLRLHLLRPFKAGHTQAKQEIDLVRCFMLCYLRCTPLRTFAWHSPFRRLACMACFRSFFDSVSFQLSDSVELSLCFHAGRRACSGEWR